MILEEFGLGLKLISQILDSHFFSSPGLSKSTIKTSLAFTNIPDILALAVQAVALHSDWKPVKASAFYPTVSES